MLSKSSPPKQMRLSIQYFLTCSFLLLCAAAHLRAAEDERTIVVGSNAAREKAGNPKPPIISRGGFDAKQRSDERLGSGAATATGAAFIDLNEIAALEYEKLGPDKVEPLFADARTHTSAAGAELNARCVTAGLRALPGAPLDRYLSQKGKSVPPAAARLVTGAVPGR